MNGNWDSLVFDIGEEYMVRVPMDDPSKGTFELVGQLLDRSNNVRDLVEALGESYIERVTEDPGW